MIVGVDLTITGGLGMCALPLGWDLEWQRVQVETWHPGQPTRGLRLRQASERVAAFVRKHDASAVYVEMVPTQAFNATKLALVGGAVFAELSRAVGIEAIDVPISTARKFCFGAVPRGAKKGDYHAQLIRMGAPAWWGPDALDAFVVANWGANESGGCSIALPQEPKKSSRRGKKS